MGFRMSHIIGILIRDGKSLRVKGDGVDMLTEYRYGTSPHGGYGIGVERLLAWMCGRYTVRECVLYPRFTGRATP